MKLLYKGHRNEDQRRSMGLKARERTLNYSL